MFVRLRELRTPGKRAFPMKSVAELLGRCELIRVMFFPYASKAPYRQFRSHTERVLHAKPRRPQSPRWGRTAVVVSR